MRIRGLVIEPRKVGLGKPRVNGLSNDLALQSLVAAKFESGDTVGAGANGTVVLVEGVFPTLIFTQTRFDPDVRQT